MKKTYILAVCVLAFTAVLYFVFSFVPKEAVSDTKAIGTIKVCWGQTCTSDVETTIVNLVNSSGVTVGTCTITPPQSCCKIQGDFPSGSYYFQYYRPTGVSDCQTAPFNYINGSEVTLNVICRCP
jgi:hypothetical protein